MATLQHLSHSSIELFAQCPSAWTAKYILGFQDKKGEAASFGSYFEGCVAASMGMKEIGYETEDGRKLKCNGDEYRSKFETPEIKKSVDNYMKQPWAWKTAARAQTFIQITPAKWREVAGEYKADPELAIKVIGYVDFDRPTPESESLPEALRPTEILDLKTGSRPEFKQSWAHQLTLYCLAMGASRWSIHRHVRGRYQQIEERKLEMSSDKGRALAKETMDRIAYISRQIKQVVDDPGLATHLPRNPGWLCDYCPLSDDCASGSIFKAANTQSSKASAAMTGTVGGTVGELLGDLDPSKGE